VKDAENFQVLLQQFKLYLVLWLLLTNLTEHYLPLRGHPFNPHKI
jgi:hypothetical protein